ncbi:MAG: hypothetical protein ACFKPT_13865 [Gloeotrichia echinulata GP01]
MINNPIAPNIIRYNSCINAEKLLGANVAAEIVQANSGRAYFAAINNSNSEITLILGETSAGGVDKGIVLNPNGGSYEINSCNLYVGKICAISATNSKLSFVECR